MRGRERVQVGGLPQLAVLQGWPWEGGTLLVREKRGVVLGGEESWVGGPSSPGCMEGSREQQLVVQGDAHVARFVESRGHSPGGVAEEAAPAQEQHLGCGEAARGTTLAAGTPFSL